MSPGGTRARPPKADLQPGNVNENPRGLSLPALLAEDLATHGHDLLSPGFWTLAVHRFGNWRMGLPRTVRPPATVAYRAAHWAVLALWGMDVPYNSKLGRRIRFDHHGCVLVGALEIGDDVVIRHSVTIGLARRNETKAPVIGSRVEIGPGACIVGGIRVGDDCYVGPNTVVAQDLPAGMAVLGVPARTVSLADIEAGTRR
jgi:serine O-acetyltransferase